MIIKEVKPKATRQSFGEELAALGASHPKLVVLDADLSKSTKSEMFAKKYPERFFEMGIQEANMIGVAAGMGLSGLTAVACSFGCFLTGRYDQIRMSVGYTRANVKLVGTHAGVTIGEDGHSQMGLEDVALMRAIPGMVILQPADEMQTRAAVRWMVDYQGPVYLRLTRQNVPAVYQEGKLPSGLAWSVFGADQADLSGVIMATGGTVGSALEAQDLLQAQGMKVAVVNASCLKPLDGKMLQALTAFPWLSVEDHSVIGGLGSALAEWSSENGGPPVLRHGIKDVFGESGDPDELVRHFQLHPQGIADLARQYFRSLGR